MKNIPTEVHHRQQLIPIPQRRMPRKRAFIGLVGRSSSEDVLPSLPSQSQLPIEQFDPERSYRETLVRFQQHAFDPKLRGVDPRKAYDKRWDSLSSEIRPTGPSSREGDSYQTSQINPDDPGLGLRMVVIREEGMRARIPWWIEDDHAFEEFLLHLVNQDKSGDEYRILKGRELRRAAGLDFNVLYEFYFSSHEDCEIFDRHEEEFKREKGRQRITSSIDALKKRRQRLVETGNAMFGKDSRPIEGSEYREHRARWASIRLAPDIKTRIRQES
jgi:hypothetical protein